MGYILVPMQKNSQVQIVWWVIIGMVVFWIFWYKPLQTKFNNVTQSVQNFKNCYGYLREYNFPDPETYNSIFKSAFFKKNDSDNCAFNIWNIIPSP